MKKKFILFSLLASTALFMAQIPSYVPTTDLVAWYNFNNNADDASSNGNNLTNTNATPTIDRFNQANSAYQFNGTAYLTTSTFSQVFNLTGAYSFSFWAKKDVAGTGIAMMSGNSASNNFVWLFQGDATNIFKFGTNKQGSSWTWLNGPVVSVGQWEHYVGVYNNKTMTFYKNGVSQGSTTNNYTSVSQSTMPLWIGRGAGTANFYQGALDDIGIWNRELTATEVMQLYQSTLSTQDATPNKKFSISPNPTSDYITVKRKDNTAFSYTIFDQTGRAVKQNDSKNTNDEKIDLTDLNSGTYYLKIGEEKSVKIIKK